jgi:uncharacterized RDD family membrane protein YckC
MRGSASIRNAPAFHLELLRANGNFGKLWLGQVVSELGDWLSAIALRHLMLEMTGRAQSVARFFVVICIPGMIVGPGRTGSTERG